MKKIALLIGLVFFVLDASAYNPTIAAESEPVQEQQLVTPGTGAEKPVAKREIARKKKRKHRKHKRNRRRHR